MNKRLTDKYFLINILCLFIIGSCMNTNQQGISLTVATSSGVVEGIITRNVISWEDIPYALPPEGDLRWKAPRPLISPESKITP